MDTLTLQPLAHCTGTVRLPGSKSLSNRALLLAAMAEGTTTIANLLDSDDIRHMLAALRQLGVQCSFDTQTHEATVSGHGGALHRSNEAQRLFLGNAGTAMRPLTAALCLGQGQFTMDGEPRMHERPIGDLIDALVPLGAQIKYLGTPGYPPLEINANGLHGGQTSIRGNVSSQYLTALLMAAPMASGTVDIAVEGELVSKPYIRITLDLMRSFGITVETDESLSRFTVQPQTYKAVPKLMVEGDASSASYFLAAAAITGGPVTVKGVGKHSVQGDVAFADALAAMGAEIDMTEDSITVTGHELRGVDLDLNHIPDAAMTLATTALFAKGRTSLRNIANWRVKETDRLDAMARELRKVGAIVEEGADHLVIDPPEQVHSAAIDTYNDHRMAMCFSLAAFGNEPITINDPGCVSKTFPDYFDQFMALCAPRSESG